MTAEEIYIKLKDELTAENESSSSPERIFIKNEGQTICTIGMNRSHEIIFVEFKPTPKDLETIEREEFVHPHPVEMLHDAGWRQAQLTSWEEAEKLLEIIHRSYKKRRKPPEERISAPVRPRKAAAGEAGAARGAAARMAGGTTKKGAERAPQRLPKAVEKAAKAGVKTRVKVEKKAKTIPKVKAKPSPRAAAKKRPQPPVKRKIIAPKKTKAPAKAAKAKAKSKVKASVKTKAKKTTVKKGPKKKAAAKKRR